MAYAMDEADSARTYDINGFFEVLDNPLSKVGVYDYLGKNIPQEKEAGNALLMFKVYRPASELSDPDCIASFRLVPWVIDHTMLGDGTGGTVTVDQKGARGVTGEQIWFDPDDEFGTLKGNIKCFSEVLAGQISGGKTPLSLGYRCVYEYAPGTFNGVAYTYVQRRIRGNHLASVDDGRMGQAVAVMDGFSFTVDAKEFIAMAVPQRKKKPQAKKGTAVAAFRLRMEAVAMDAEETAADPATSDADKGEIAEALATIKKLLPLLEAAEAVKGVGDVPAEDPADTPSVSATGDAEADAEAARKEKEAKTGDADLEGKGMDAKEVAAMIDKAVKAALAAQPVATMDASEIYVDMNMRNVLASQLSEFVGTFDHSEKTALQVAQYGCEKLGLTAVKGAEVATVQAYLKDRTPPRKLATATAMDAKEGKAPDWMAAQLNEQK